MLELHGYSHFVERNILNKPQRRFVKDDVLIIRYSMELITKSGGALQLPPNPPMPQEDIKVNPHQAPNSSPLLATLLAGNVQLLKK